MQIHLDRVRDEPFTWDREVEVGAESLGRTELLKLGPVRWRGRIEATAGAAGEFLLTGHLSYEQTLACTRCLAPRTETVDRDLQLLVVQRRSEPLPGEYALEEVDLNVVEVDSELLDTTPLIEDQLQLEIPMRVLCRPDCAGLCPRCGADLNAGACECPEREMDPRWQALAEMRKQS